MQLIKVAFCRLNLVNQYLYVFNFTIIFGKMSIIKIIQESDLIKNHTLFPLKIKTDEVDKLQKTIKEKDVIISNNNVKIQELESHISDLEKSLETTTETYELERRKVARDKINFDVVYKYEKLLNQITADYEIMREERNAATEHLACIEAGFADLLNKFERLKTIVIGYQENQEVLIDFYHKHQKAIEITQTRYDDLKVYTSNKLDEANKHLAKSRKRHVSEMAKIKTQALQSKVRINELEKTVARLKVEAATATAEATTVSETKKSGESLK